MRERLVAGARIAGPRMREARVAAPCLHHRATEPWTADRDFSSFASLRVRTPLVAA